MQKSFKKLEKKQNTCEVIKAKKSQNFEKESKKRMHFST